ncbi:carboxylating nicotinate-nucleotide diphosphorylase [Urinicoccus massiliensis]|uniref:carboxylating nicotinate-nucleotide diphosphorylase n=1 Tax=Urinicoccus massiliensis TaxID=1723382 RepID=UPI00092FEF6F|nr:carboxylating nicotinate-nucleotide diphosphorylase [Urinicoccus massiliensis]
MYRLENYNRHKIDQCIQTALDEDIITEDLSTNAIYDQGQKARVDLLAKEDGVLCGRYVFERVFSLLDSQVQVDWTLEEGAHFKKGDLLAKISGDVRPILTGERTALNFLQRLCGVASYTRDIVDQLEGSGIRLMDTRKTTPGLRLLQKYAVTVGGGKNHRTNLSDVIMLKDNHIQAAGGVGAAIQKAKTYAPFVRTIVVETENLDMVQEAVENKASIIMLDNMDRDQMEEAIKLIDGRCFIEVSGNVTRESIRDLKGLKIDYISSGALTHSSGIIDLSMKNLRLL